MDTTFKEIVDEIVARHHSLLRRELPRITEQLDSLVETCVDNEALGEARQIFAKVRSKIEAHLRDEELILFPTGIALEGGGAIPATDMDLLERLTEMEMEHDGCGAALAGIAATVASVSPGALRDQLAATIQIVQDDLCIHVEKENHTVHPRFLELMAARRR